jgi:hypothetical protein
LRIQRPQFPVDRSASLTRSHHLPSFTRIGCLGTLKGKVDIANEHGRTSERSSWSPSGCAKGTAPARPNDQPNDQADDEAQSEETSYEQHDCDAVTHESTKAMKVRSIPRPSVRSPSIRA